MAAASIQTCRIMIIDRQNARQARRFNYQKPSQMSEGLYLHWMNKNGWWWWCSNVDVVNYLNTGIAELSKIFWNIKTLLRNISQLKTDKKFLIRKIQKKKLGISTRKFKSMKNGRATGLEDVLGEMIKNWSVSTWRIIADLTIKLYISNKNVQIGKYYKLSIYKRWSWEVPNTRAFNCEVKYSKQKKSINERKNIEILKGVTYREFDHITVIHRGTIQKDNEITWLLYTHLIRHTIGYLEIYYGIFWERY